MLTDTKTGSGVLLVAGESWPATVTLRVYREPNRSVGRQEVEVAFAEDAPAEHAVVRAGEVSFEAEGKTWTPQYSGSRWLLREAQSFLRD